MFFNATAKFVHLVCKEEQRLPPTHAVIGVAGNIMQLNRLYNVSGYSDLNMPEWSTEESGPAVGLMPEAEVASWTAALNILCGGPAPTTEVLF